MRRIEKGQPPQSFTNWIRRKPTNMNENQWFGELHKQNQWDVINDLSLHNTKEQFYICAYCCQRIEGTANDTVNEHVEARSIAPNRSLDHTNIVASCKTKGQCDNSHGSAPLHLTPFMEECETELKFNLSGRVEGLTQRAKDIIDVLNLGDNERNNKALIEKRKQLSHNLLWNNGIDHNDVIEDDDLIRSVVEDLLKPKNGKLEPFAPAVANILRNQIST